MYTERDTRNRDTRKRDTRNKHQDKFLSCHTRNRFMLTNLA